MAEKKTIVAGGLMPSAIIGELIEKIEEEMLRSTPIDRDAKTLKVPKHMSYDQAIKVLTRKKEEEETEVQIMEPINAFPFDAAHALTLVIKEKFGFSANETSTFSFFGEEFTFAPRLIRVQIGPDEGTQLPWGEFSLPGIDGKLESSFWKKDDRVIYCLKGLVKGKHKAAVEELANDVRVKLKTDSIYKGKAIKISFRDANGERIFFDPTVVPQFMRLDGPEKPIFTKSTEDQLEISVLNSIRHTERLKKNGIPVKRSILLEGGFGTGKTITALQIARECVEHGWTFLYVDRCEDLKNAMFLADDYAPAVVFAEDADRVMSGDRDPDMDELSYVLDGVDTKNKEIVTVLTTNNVNDIQQLMLRPGRIDSVVSIEPPDVDTVYRLLQHYTKDLMQGDPDEFKAAISGMVGQTPAFIAEVASKAKLSAVSRDSSIIIRPKDIRVAVTLMQNHVKLMEKKPEPKHEEIPISELLVRRQGNGIALPPVAPAAK